jgi:hypothetical protein
VTQLFPHQHDANTWLSLVELELLARAVAGERIDLREKERLAAIVRRHRQGPARRPHHLT